MFSGHAFTSAIVVVKVVLFAAITDVCDALPFNKSVVEDIIDASPATGTLSERAVVVDASTTSITADFTSDVVVAVVVGVSDTATSVG